MRRLFIVFAVILTASAVLSGEPSKQAGQRKGYHLHDFGIAKVLLSPGMHERVTSIDLLYMEEEDSDDVIINKSWVSGDRFEIYVTEIDMAAMTQLNILSRRVYENNFTLGKKKIRDVVYLLEMSFGD